MPGQDSVIGALLVASWLDAMLLMLEYSQAIYYFMHYPKDRLANKMLVVILLHLDTVGEVGHNILVYLYAVTHWGDKIFVASQHWPAALYLPTGALSALIVQMFLIRRLWRLSANLLVTLPLVLFSLASFVGTIGCLVDSLQNPLYKDLEKAALPSVVWLMGGVLADTGITTSLIWQLRKAKSMLVDDPLLRRITVIAISTGTPPAILAITSIICGAFQSQSGSTVSIGISFCLARSYSNTLLFNLNMRGQPERNSVQKGRLRAVSGARSNPDVRRVAGQMPALPFAPQVMVEEETYTASEFDGDVTQVYEDATFDDAKGSFAV